MEITLKSIPTANVKLALATHYKQYKLAFRGQTVHMTRKPYQLHPHFLLDFNTHVKTFVVPYSDAQAVTLALLAITTRDASPVKNLLPVDKQRLLSTAFGLSSLTVSELFAAVFDWPLSRVVLAFEEAAKAEYITDMYSTDPPYEDLP